MKIVDLRTEYKINPIGIDIKKPRLSWKLQSDKKGIFQQAYILQFSSSEDFENDKLLWESGWVKTQQTTNIEIYYILKSQQRIYWRVNVQNNFSEESGWSKVQYFEAGLLNASDWNGKWIESGISEDISESTPCPFFRKSIEINKKIAQACLYVSAKGLYEFYCNGERVGDEYFNPGWTSYQKRIQYQTYDLTTAITTGENVLGAIVGDGWYRGFLVWQGNKNTYGDKSALIAQLVVDYTDGSYDIFATDETWQTLTGPILKSDIYNGETYDANLELNGWNSRNYKDDDWKFANIQSDDVSMLVAIENEPVRIPQKIKPIEKIITPEGELVFDFGQNLVGWVQFKLKGSKGDQINLRHAEVLDESGNFYLENIRAAKAEDNYIFKGEGLETYHPRFTFHGFRYVRIEKYRGDVKLEDLEAHVLHSDMEPIGSFECSDPLINQLCKNIDWGLRGNFLDVPTDCPQRDERLGWTGDAQVFASTASFNRNTALFYSKWMKDFPIEQKADGSVPWVVPNVVPNGGGTGWSDGFGATGWSDAAIIIPWEVYQTFGDIRILENQYASMKAWEEYMIFHSGKKYLFEYGFHFGDWLSFAEYMSYHYNAPDYGYAGAYTEKTLIATAYFYHSTNLMMKIANVLGKTEDAKKYQSILPKIKEAFQTEFMTPNGRLTSNSQAAYAIGLMFGLHEGKISENWAKRLADDVMHFEHLTTGFLGTPVLCDALSNYGYPELAYKLLFNKRYPSWLYPVTQGATTIWERWDGIKPDGTFQNEGMNSFNHYAYGAIGNWIYSRLGGLNKMEKFPGYKQYEIKPLIPKEINFSRLKYESVYGTILINWEKVGDGIKMEFEVPANTFALVYFPSVDTDLRLLNIEGMEFMEQGDQSTIFKVVSGKYTIESKTRVEVN